jgi:hypothetical protein
MRGFTRSAAARHAAQHAEAQADGADGNEIRFVPLRRDQCDDALHERDFMNRARLPLRSQLYPHR